MFDNLPKRAPQTRDEYIAELCLKNGVTPEEVDAVLTIEQCNCPYAGCTGWIAWPKGK